MPLKILRAFSFRLLSYLLTMQPVLVLCQRQFSQNFMVPEPWRNYCPDRLARPGTYVETRGGCAAECSFTPQCIGFSYYDSSQLCYLYDSVPPKIFYDSDCTFMMDLDALSGCSTKACMQGSCDCTNDEFYGCLTLTKINGSLTVCLAPPGLPVQMVEVDIELGNGSIPLPSVNNWIVIMQRFDSSLSFNQTWTAYRNGFGNWKDQGQFWLGNEMVHLLTNRTGLVYRLHVEVQLYTLGKWFGADYANFSLDAESDNYVIHLSGYSGSAGDSLTNTTVPKWYHGGMNFSTWDIDIDNSPTRNCAKVFQAGWWYNDCWTACLTCSGSSFAWETLKYLELHGRLRAARMMIRSA